MTKNEKYIVDMYVRYFGQAASEDTIAKYATEKKASKILKNIRDDADAEKVGLSTEDFVNNAFQNLFGRDATTKQMNKYSKVIEKGKNLPIQSIVKSAAKADKDVYENKKAVALKYAELGGKDDLDLSKISKGSLVDLNKVVTLTDLTNAIEDLADNSGIPSSFDGKTFVLTENVDTFVGTNKGDLFVADATSKITASSADTLDGGKGVDTFKVYDATGATVGLRTLPTLKNIEKVVIYDNHDGDANLTKWDTVETLFLVGDIDAATAATGIELGEKVTTVNLEDVDTTGAAQILNFDDALTAATLGVNKVINSGAAGTIDVTNGGTALKTLTVDASGKASTITLANTAADIETLNITGRANLDLTLNAASLGTTVKTVDGSKAQGDLTFSNTANMTSIKTGSGNDTVTLAVAVESGETINLGAGNDKLVDGAAGSVVTSTTTVIDGGAGIDSLDSALVTVGNAGVFANFETISLTTATVAGAALDMDLLTKSTITSIAKDANVVNELINVKKSQALTVNTSTALATTLTFKASEVAGTADAYTINFNADNAAANFDAGTVSVEKIETVIVNSVGKTGATNIIDLKDADAKSLVITGDKDLTVAFDTAFGTIATATNGLGVSTIDASASTAGITLGSLVTNLNVANEGLTIKGGAGADSITTDAIAYAININSGAGDDTIILTGATTATDKIIVNAGAGVDKITVGTTGGTFTLGAGKDEITVTAAKAATGTVTITDIEKGDVIKGLTGALFAKADITGAVNLDDAFVKAANTGNVTWFQYTDGNTYIVDAAATGSFTAATDIAVKLNGLVDLGNSTISAGDITIA